MKPELHVRSRLGWIGAGLVSYALFQIAAQFPAAAEVVFSSPAFHVPGWILAKATGWIPFAVVEWIVVAIATLALLWLARGVMAWRRRERSAAHLAGDAMLRLGALSGVLVLAFYATIGHYFARPPLRERMDLTLPDSVGVAELTAVVRALADSTNAAYLRLHNGQADGSATAVTSAQRDRAAAALERSWAASVQKYNLDAHLGWRHAPPKAPFFSSGFYERRQPGQYVFFTGETMVAGGNPVLQWAKTVAHEQAHQRGIAHEGDANFLAYLVGSNTDDDLVRYAVSHFAYEQLFPSLWQVGRDSAVAVRRRILPGVRADIRARNAYFAGGRDRIATVARAVNNTYLRAQRVSDGVASYSHSAGMILALHLKYDEGQRQ